METRSGRTKEEQRTSFFPSYTKTLSVRTYDQVTFEGSLQRTLRKWVDEIPRTVGTTPVEKITVLSIGGEGDEGVRGWIRGCGRKSKRGGSFLKGVNMDKMLHRLIQFMNKRV